ncbi:MAG: DNA-binding protein [Lentisphaeria bacterium]|nr:DNA-binding protein [Lentisphaeria bacterium]
MALRDFFKNVIRRRGLFNAKVSAIDNFVYTLSIDSGAEITESFTNFIKARKIKHGTIRGIGAVESATLRFFDPVSKTYQDHVFNEQMEIAHLEGNISTLDGKVYLHIHAVLGKSDCTAVAGHLLNAKIKGAGEFFIQRYCTEVKRKFSEEIGLNIYDF